MKKMNKKGFTIVELVIVITVIAILSAVLIPTFTSVVRNSKDSAAIQDAKNAYTQYLADNAVEPAENLIYAYDEDRYVLINEGELYQENGEVKIFPTLAEAEAIFDYAADADGEGEGTTPTHNKAADANNSKLTIYTDYVAEEAGA